MSQQELLRAAVDDFGAVRGVRAYYEFPGLLGAVQIVFDHGALTIEAVADDDTIIASTQPGPNADYRHVSAEHPWSSIVDGQPLWIWTLTNQQGYTDGMQLLVKLDGRDDVGVQLMVMASMLYISVSEILREV